MEISRDALMRVIRAARAAKELGDDIRRLSHDSIHDNVADRIAGDLADALQMMNGESMGVADDFLESQTYGWLFKCSVPEDRIAGEFIRMAKENESQQPKPCLMTEKEFDELLKRNGGYKAETPEGEWQ